MKLKRWSLCMLAAVATTGVALTVAVHADDKMMSSKMSSSKMSSSKMGMADARSQNAKMLIQTLSEEKTEINTLAAQQAAFRKMGGTENLKIAAMWGRWITEHKAGEPMFEQLIKANGGDPAQAKILKPPVLGSRDAMMMATHKDHQAAVASSRMRAARTNSAAIKQAMKKRMALASKHLKQMAPLHHSMKM